MKDLKRREARLDHPAEVHELSYAGMVQSELRTLLGDGVNKASSQDALVVLHILKLASLKKNSKGEKKKNEIK